MIKRYDTLISSLFLLSFHEKITTIVNRKVTNTKERAKHMIHMCQNKLNLYYKRSLDVLNICMVKIFTTIPRKQKKKKILNCLEIETHHKHDFK